MTDPGLRAMLLLSSTLLSHWELWELTDVSIFTAVTRSSISFLLLFYFGL